jgi:hypothetical protein
MKNDTSKARARLPYCKFVFLAKVHTPRKCITKIIPLQAWRGPEDSRRLRLPDFKTIGI